MSTLYSCKWLTIACKAPPTKKHTQYHFVFYLTVSIIYHNGKVIERMKEGAKKEVWGSQWRNTVFRGETF